MPMQLFLLILFAFILGAVIGSFLNVCIYRIPAGISIIRPRSRCPQCGTPIAWYHNLPILSWVLLQGAVRLPAARHSRCATRWSRP